MKKLLSWLIVSLLAAVLLASMVQADSKDVTLKFVIWDPSTRPAIDKINNAFTKENPNIKVEVDVVPGDQYEKIIKTRVLSGEAPDVFLWFASSVYKMAMNNYWGDLSKEKWISSLLPAYKATSSYNGKLYALPIDYTAEGVFYNKKAFKDAGITNLPKTYGEFLDVCEKLKSKGITPLGIGGRDAWSPTHFLAPMYGSFVTAKNPNFQVNRFDGKVSFAKSEFKTVLQKFSELLDKDYINKGSLGIPFDQMVQGLADGKYAMTFMGAWIVGMAEKANPKTEIGYFAFPNEAGKAGIISLPDKALGYSPTGKNIAAAKKYISFWARPNVIKMYVDYTKSLCCVKGVLADDMPAAWNEMAEALKKYPAFSFYNVFWPASTGDDITKICQDMLAGERDLDKFLNQLDKSYDADKSQVVRPIFK